MKISWKWNKMNAGCTAVLTLFAILLCMGTNTAPAVSLLFAAAAFAVLSLKIELNEKLPWLWTSVLFVGGATLSTFSIQFLLLEPELFSKMSQTKWLLNVLCVLTVYLFTLLFTNHAGISCAISHIFFVLLGFVDYFVYMFRQNEFSFADLRSVGTGLSVAENYHFEVNSRCVYVILWSILFVLFAVKLQIRFAEKLHMRIIGVLLMALAIIPVGMRMGGYNTETWEMKGTYRNGYVLNFILGIRDSFISEPEEYSTELIAELEHQYTNSEDTNSEKEPTIIVIMNESFADLSVLGELNTNMPLTPNLDALQDNTLRGYALSSVFGAKTPNSEWEFLTGNTMAFLPAGSVVYQQYLNSQPTSLVSELKEIGYTCVAMHPHYATGWSRDTVYPKLGFDEMSFIDEFDTTDLIRKYISDQQVYDKIIRRFEQKGEDEKLYLFGVTMQNHGGYTEVYDNFEQNYYKTGTSYTDANQYFSLIHESDEALGNLISYFRNVEEPVEIVFFGDHQPSLTSSFYPLLNGKGLSGLTLEELEALYTVPFFIWTNYETEEEEIPISSLNFLSTLVLERAGLPLSSYHQFLSDLMEVVPAINSRGYYSKSRQTYQYVEDAVGEEAEWIRNYRVLQYNSMFDKKNRSQIFFPYSLGD